MATTPDNIREKVHHLADQLPKDATWDDVIEKARFESFRQACVTPCFDARTG